MKLLRILTGIHAGAEVRLTEGSHRIGSDDEAEIRISDWLGADVVLDVDASGLVRATRNTSEAAPSEGQDQDETIDPGTVVMLDFVPMQFDESVLCIGDEEMEWPSDLALLATLLQKPVEEERAAELATREAMRAKRRRMAGIVSACAVLGTVAVIGTFMLTTSDSRAALAPSTPDLLGRLNRSLDSAHLTELHASSGAQGRIVVSGMVPGSSEDYAVRRIIDTLPPGGRERVLRQYGIADNTARSVEDALQIEGAHVRYEGHGTFVVGGRVASLAALQGAVARVKPDLDKSVRQLRIEASDGGEAAPAAAASSVYSALLSADGLRYAQTPDGVKHIYVNEDEQAATDGP